MADSETALIVGAGAGLSASLARLFASEGMGVALAARKTDKLKALTEEIGARCYRCDAGDPGQVEALFNSVVADLGVPDVVVYNPSRRVHAPLIELLAEEVEKAIRVTCYGGFLVGQAAARLMLERGSGSILFTGASASVKGYPRSATFAMGKFGLRGLAQSMARELAPKNIHVAHFVIDGGIRGPRHAGGDEDAHLDPDAIARTYLHAHRQHRSAWTWEFEMRPWIETF
jgi:NAD(P)-dependent dehydrogenase (short-subunit alcohol dehydrogenase family)